MSAQIRWNPRRSLMPLANDLLFSRFMEYIGEFPLTGDTTWCPTMDLVEEKDHLVARIDLPGIDPKNIKVSLQDETLIIEGERLVEHEKKEGKHLCQEQIFGAFHRSLRLPHKVHPDKVKATSENGVMTITMQKSEEQESRRIPISIK